MTLTVREMTLAETGIIIDYFQGATPEYLEMLGVDPTRLPTPEGWRERFQRHFALPVEKRIALLVIWLSDDRAIGYSTSDKIIYGEQANMHLHVTDPERRNSGIGVAPNRALQKAGFKYLKTHMTVPGPFNLHQAVTRWVMEP
jgi:hypothetical protein